MPSPPQLTTVPMEADEVKQRHDHVLLTTHAMFTQLWGFLLVRLHQYWINIGLRLTRSCRSRQIVSLLP